MSKHDCGRCHGLRSGIAETEGAIRHLLNTLQKYPGTPRAKGVVTQLAAKKSSLALNRRMLADHLDEMGVTA